MTPWEVSGDVDYDKLVRDFGAAKISDEQLANALEQNPETLGDY